MSIPLLQAAFDNGSSSCQGKTNSETAFSRKHFTTSGPPGDERPMIAPTAQMISSFSIPAIVQKTTLSDER